MFSQMIIIKPTMINPSVILSEDVFPKLHLLFVNNDCKFGLSFPAYTFKSHGDLGNIIEVLCEDKNALASLDLVTVFKSVEDVKVLPGINETNDYTLFRRVREKSRIEKYSERYQKRNGEIPDKLKGHVQKHNRRVFSNAYIRVKSFSTGKRYNIFVKPVEQKYSRFNAYGLVVV